MKMNGSGDFARDGRVVSIVGGGWSVKAQGIDLARLPGFKIGINESGVLMPKVDIILSMDRLWTEDRWPKIKARMVPFYARRSALQNIDWFGEDWVRQFECDHETVEFSETNDRLNGTNSGTCGMNLAYLMRPEILYMFGFDMCRSPKGEAYWHPPYTWTAPQGGTKSGKYDIWAAEFNMIALKFAAIGTRVYNVSPVSKIGSFEKISASELGLT
jgi:hypothetical protein